MLSKVRWLSSRTVEFLPRRHVLSGGSLALIASAVLALSGTAIPVAVADPISPLSVTKTATPNPVASGAQLTYTITTVNTGGAKVDNIVMTDQVNGVGVIQSPPALPQLIITSSKGTCSQGGPNGNVVTCNAGTLAGGESWVVTIRGQVTASNGTTLNNTASITGTRSAQNFTTNATVSLLVQNSGGGSLPDLTINKTGPSSVATSSPITYTLTVNNLGAVNATAVKVVDTVPAGVTSITASATSLFVCSVTGPTVTCTGGAVNAGANASITIKGTSPSTAGTITNTAVVDPDNTIAEANEFNNTSATVNTSVGGTPAPPLLDIKKTDGNPAPAGTWWTGAGPDPVTPGQKLTYKILITNNATGTNSRADDVVVTDGTQGLEASSISVSQVVVNGTVGNGNGCVVISPQVRCSIRSLNSGGTVTVTIAGTVIASAGTTIFNTATVTGNVKNTGVSSSASEATTVRPAIDLTITKDDAPDPVCARSWPNPAGTPPHLPSPPLGLSAASGTVPPLLAAPVCLGGLTYRLVVGNSGLATATGVTVRDPLPAGLIFDSYQDVDGAGFSCGVDSANVVTCTDGTVPAASIVHLNLLVVAPPNTGTITNTVYVDPNNAIFESDETNNTFTQTTQVVTGIDLVVWKSDSNPSDPPGAGAPSLAPQTLADGFDPIATRGTETYTIVVDNVGTQDASGIRLRDTLPADTIFLSVIAADPAHPADPTHGFTCAHDGSPTGGVVECIGGHLLGTESEFYDPAGPPPAGPGDDFAIIKIKVFARSTVGAMHNEVRVDPLNEIAEVNELNNIATDDTSVVTGNADKGAFNQLKITKTQVDPSPSATPPDPDFTVATNGTLIYDLKVENLGTDPVSAIAVKDFLPSGSRFIEAKDTDTGASIADAFLCVHDGSLTGGVITCTGGALSGSVTTIPESPGPGTVPTFRDIKIKVFAPNTPGTYTNLAKVDPDNTIAEGNEFDNASQIDTVVTVGGNNMFNELTISKTQTDPTTTCGLPAFPCVATSSVVTYHIDVANAGSDPAFNVKVTDTLPSGFSYISAVDTSPASDPHNFVCSSPDGKVVNCTGATLSGTINLSPGEPTSRTIELKAFAAAQPGTYTNTAIVDPDNAIPEGNETNNTATVRTNVRVGNGFIDLQISKTASPGELPGSHVTPLGQINYTLVVSNAGTDPAFNVKVRDVLPAGTTFVSAADNTPGSGAFTCTFSAPNVDCTGATIDGTSGLAAPLPTSRQINIVVAAPNATGIKLTNQAIVDPDNSIAESNETNNSAIAKTDVQSDINLTIQKTGPKSAHQNDTTQYVLTASNKGTAAAKGVEVIDPLPVGLIPLGSVQATPGNFACQVLENPVNVVSCVGDLNGTGDPNGFDTVTITIPVFITADGGTLDNQACVDPNNKIVESNEFDNCSENLTPVTKKAPDLLINKSADKGSVTAGDPITYTLSISNSGDGDATGPITVTDTLPPATVADFVSANPDAAFSCPAPAGNVLTCTAGAGLTSGAAAKITILMNVKSPLPAGTTSIINTADVSPGTCSAVDCENEAVNPNRLTNNSATVTTSIGGSPIDLVMVNNANFDSPDPVVVGGKLTYTLVVTNAGSASTTTDPAPNTVVIRTTLPAGLDLNSAAASGGFICSPAGPKAGPVGDVDCSGDLAAGATTTVTITTTVTAAAGTSLSVTATADPNNDIVESNEGNNSQTAITSVVAAPCTACIDLTVGSIFATPNPVKNNNDVTYNFTVTNIGDRPTSADPAPNAVVVTINLDTIFNESTPVSVSAPGFTCVTTSPPVPVSAPEIVCTSTTGLAAGAGALFSVVAHANTAVVPSFVNFDVSIDPNNDVAEFNEANNTATLKVNTIP